MPRSLRSMVALVLGLSATFPALADDPPEKLTPAQRRVLEGEWHRLAAAAVKLDQEEKLQDSAAVWEKALGVARRLYPTTESTPGHENLSLTLNNLANSLRNRNKPAEAEPYYREALAVNERLYPKEDHPRLARSQTSLATVLRELGRYKEAEELFRKALDVDRGLYPDQDHPGVAWGLNNLGQVLLDRGNYAEAERVLRDALEMRQRLYPGQDHPELASSLNNLAAVLHTRGKLTEAERLYREALAMRKRLYPGRISRLLATSVTNLASVLQAQGKLAEAEKVYGESLAMTRRLFAGEDHPDLASDMNNLAGVLQRRGKYETAEPLYRDALEMIKRLHARQDHPEVAESTNNLAYVLAAQGKYEEAEPQYRDALAMYRRLYRGQNQPRMANFQINLASLLAVQGKQVEAASLFRDALRILYAVAAADALVRPEGDALTLAAAQPAVRDLYLSNAWSMSADPAAVYADVWAMKANLTRVYERRALAARAAASAPRAAALLAQVTDKRRQRAELLMAPVAADAAARQRRTTEIAALSRDLETLDRELRPLLPAIVRAEKLAAASPTNLQAVLPADTVLVDFLHYARYRQDADKPGVRGQTITSRYLAFVVTREKVSWVDMGPAKPLEEAIAAWREAITEGKEIPAELSARVRDLTWAKVRAELPAGIKTVYVSPDVALCRVPWAAVPGDKPNTILLEDYAVAVVPHGVFLLDKLGPPDPVSHPSDSVLVAGGIDYDAEVKTAVPAGASRDLPVKEEAPLGWLSLPGTAAEAAGVARLAAAAKRPTVVLAGTKASAAAVLDALPKAKYAHIATHGFFADPAFRSVFQLDPELFRVTLRGERVGAGAMSPLVMTGLVFAGANHPRTPGRGILTGEGLVDLDLSSLDLAVLSACETGLGDVAGSEGAFGLQRAFHLAGGRNVVASLWKVPDQSTVALMALFYHQLWEKGQSPLESLRQAQLELYRNPGKIAELAKGFRGKFEEVPGAGGAVKPGRDGKAHPGLWAAFTLSGLGR